jgi:hypothetical protein
MFPALILTNKEGCSALRVTRFTLCEFVHRLLTSYEHLTASLTGRFLLYWLFKSLLQFYFFYPKIIKLKIKPLKTLSL